ncbi:hypothetical protein EV363DRAFT_1318201, partial [Boletus edulis]
VLYDQAEKPMSKSTFPASVTSPETVRYHRFKAVKSTDTAAHRNLQRAGEPHWQGFHLAVHFFVFVMVGLLMRDV